MVTQSAGSGAGESAGGMRPRRELRHGRADGAATTDLDLERASQTSGPASIWTRREASAA